MLIISNTVELNDNKLHNFITTLTENHNSHYIISIISIVAFGYNCQIYSNCT